MDENNIQKMNNHQVLTTQDPNVEKEKSNLQMVGSTSKLQAPVPVKHSGLKAPTMLPPPSTVVAAVKRKCSPEEEKQLAKKQRMTSDSSSSTSSGGTNHSSMPTSRLPPQGQVFRATGLQKPSSIAAKQPPKNHLIKTASYSSLFTSANNRNAPVSNRPAQRGPTAAATVNKFKKMAADALLPPKKPPNPTALQARIQELENIIKEKDECSSLEMERHKQQTNDYESKLKSIKEQKTELECTISSLNVKVAGLEASLAATVAGKAAAEADLLSAKMLIKQHELRIKEQKGEISMMKSKIEEYTVELEQARMQSMREESMRRKLHNTIQELKGNIRVFSRVRPLLGDELLGMDSDVPQHINFPDPDKKILELEKLAGIMPNESVASVKRGSSSKYEFQFDRVFPPSSTQTEVFHEISQLVQSALDGYNVCIFAYGQTGSGKTFTMEGRGTGDNRGMIPRSVEKIFATRDELLDKGWIYKIEVSFLEIYNETIRDLLVQSRGQVDSTKHDIKLVGPNTNEVFVTDLTTVEVRDQDAVEVLLKRALENRSVAETKCNERSSRSHSIFRMKIIGSNSVTAESCVGLLNLVDLAGSERLKESGSQGQRLKETQNINKSLANLSNVIMALANKETHVPYRNSKLTHLLQNCLGGSSKMLMFVNVSPREECFQETLNSLRFATQVNQCNIGQAQKKVK